MKDIVFVVRLDNKTARTLDRLAKEAGEARAVVVRSLIRAADRNGDRPTALPVQAEAQHERAAA